MRLTQVLSNLIGNATKFTDRGEIGVELGYSSETGIVTISVSDTGSGIAAEDIDSIFSPFKQASQKCRMTQQGTGLGLPIVKELISLMGGTIECRSQPGIGSIFTINIPTKLRRGGIVPKTSSGELHKSQSLKLVDNTKKHILVVDDNHTNRLLLQARLEKVGFEVTLAENGRSYKAL